MQNSTCGCKSIRTLVSIAKLNNICTIRHFYTFTLTLDQPNALLCRSTLA
jgi:hypothetical protein